MPFRHVMLACLVAIVWGLNFVVIKIGLESFPPFLFSALRFLCAALPAVFFVARPKVSWKAIVLLGLILGVVKYSLMFLGIDVGMSAGLASLLIQAQVFFTVLIAIIFVGERMSPAQAIGLFIGLSGLFLIGYEANGELSIVPFLLIMGAAIAWAVSNTLLKRLGSVNMFSVMVWMSLVPIIPMLLMSAVFEGPDAMMLAWDGISWISIGAVIYVSLIATVWAFSVWGRLLAEHPAGSVAPFALLVPVVGMFSSAILLDETFSDIEIVAFAFIFCGLLTIVFGSRLVVIWSILVQLPNGRLSKTPLISALVHYAKHRPK